MSFQPVSILVAVIIGAPKVAPIAGAVTGTVIGGGLELAHVAADHILLHHVTGHGFLLSAGTGPALLIVLILGL